MIAVTHPLVRHKVGRLRDPDLGAAAFRALTRELALLLAVEATADLPLGAVTVPCWSGPVSVDSLAGRAPTVVPILRAGLGMLDGLLDLLPDAPVSMVGLARDHQTLRPVAYHDHLVNHIEERVAFVIDPMLATAGSMIATIDLLKSRGCRDIRALVLVAAPEGITALQAAHPEVRCWAAAIDHHLNEAGYIIPGLGDAGDRIFGTQER
jgi:uracil phosphoribosyltransferase